MTGLSDKQLLELLETAKEGADGDVIESYENNYLLVSNFVKKLGLDSGEHKVTSRLLYKLFITMTSKPVQQKAFTANLARFLPNKRINTGTMFFLNRDFKTIDELLTKKLKYKYSRSIKYQHKYFQQFMNDTKLGAGVNWIEGYIIYEMYKRYLTQIGKVRRMAYVKFMVLIKAYFKRKGEKFAINNSYIKYVPSKDVYQMRRARKKYIPPKQKLESKELSKRQKQARNDTVSSP